MTRSAAKPSGCEVRARTLKIYKLARLSRPSEGFSSMPGIVAPAPAPHPLIAMNKAMVMSQGPEDDAPGFGLPFLATSSSSATTPGLDVFWAHPADDARYCHGRYLRGPAERACVTPDAFWPYASIHDVSLPVCLCCVVTRSHIPLPSCLDLSVQSQSAEALTIKHGQPPLTTH